MQESRKYKCPTFQYVDLRTQWCRTPQHFSMFYHVVSIGESSYVLFSVKVIPRIGDLLKISVVNYLSSAIIMIMIMMLNGKVDKKGFR